MTAHMPQPRTPDPALPNEAGRLPGGRWRCVYCHDAMDRRYRRTHLLKEWMFHRLRNNGG